MDLDEHYTKVDTAKIMDAADKLDELVARLREQMNNLDTAAKNLKRSTKWKGEAADKWYVDYYHSYEQLKDNVDKYAGFSAWMRDRVQTYLLYAAKAQGLADNLDSEVSKLVSGLLLQSGASLKEIQDEAKKYYKSKSKKGKSKGK